MSLTAWIDSKQAKEGNSRVRLEVTDNRVKTWMPIKDGQECLKCPFSPPRPRNMYPVFKSKRCIMQ